MTPVVALPPPAPPAVALPRGRAAAPYAFGFFLFLVLNAALFVRPAEIVPAVVGWNIYEFLILACFAASFPVVLEQLSTKALEERPITVCVLGVFLAIVLSHLARLDFAKVAFTGMDFAKVVLYYLLFVGLVNSPARLRLFLFWMLLFAATTVSLAVLQYHGVITLPNLAQTIDNGAEDASGTSTRIVRLCGSGIFQDPNDLGVLIAASTVLSLYWLSDRASGPARLLWLGPLALFVYAMSLTQSRGALLALLGGLSVCLVARFGWRTALLIAAAVVPLLFLSLGSRQTDLTTEGGTGQQRIQVWRDGLMLVRESPLFGIGKDEYAARVGLVAHNSYLHCFAELGVFGGMFFLGAFYLAASQLLRLGDRRRHVILDPEARRLHPYIFGVVASWAVGMMSLTLCFILPTYTVLALATAYMRTTPADPPAPAPRFDVRLLVRLLVVAAVGFAVLYVSVLLLVEH